MSPPVTLRPSREEDRAFLFELHRAALGEYVTAIWGWDEQVQRTMFDAEFVGEGQQIVVLGGTDIGMLRVIDAGDHLEVDLIELLPAFQRRGIGTQLLQQVLDQAERQALPLRLQVLRVNPARWLYERLGFVVVGETHTHFLMERAPKT